MSRKHRPTRTARTTRTARAMKRTDHPLGGQVARGAAAGAARSLLDWLIGLVREHFEAR
ncbi:MULTISPECIES: hypothetical protein [Kitasatospora]|nr:MULTISPECIES: hypothetical protein [Kitasatospora]